MVIDNQGGKYVGRTDCFVEEIISSGAYAPLLCIFSLMFFYKKSENDGMPLFKG